MNINLSDEISVTSIIEFENLLFEYPIRKLAEFQVHIFSHEDFIKTRDGLTTMGNDIGEHWTNAWIKYSCLGFGKEIISDDSPIKKLLPIGSKHWTSFKELYAAIEKIKSTKMAEFDEEIFTQSCISQLRLKFIKAIFPAFFCKASESIKESTNRINNLKSKSTVTNDTILRDYLEASIDKLSPENNIGHSLNPLTIQSPTRNMISPNKTGLYVFEMIEEWGNQINISGKIAFKENAKKQRVYMSAIDLIQILKPHCILNFEEFESSEHYKEKYYTKTEYFKRYAKKRIMATELFLQ
jgi:hypothetical protein